MTSMQTVAELAWPGVDPTSRMSVSPCYSTSRRAPRAATQARDHEYDKYEKAMVYSLAGVRLAVDHRQWNLYHVVINLSGLGVLAQRTEDAIGTLGDNLIPVLANVHSSGGCACAGAPRPGSRS